MFTSPGEIAFFIGKIPVRYYGLCLASGMILGLTLAYWICKKFYKELNPETVFDIAIPVIIFGIIGARIYYCLFSWNYYSNNPIEIIQIYKGGLSIHGGILGGLTGGIIYAKTKNLPILKLCDIFSFALVCGQIIGRWGNFFNSEAFGSPCDNFLKLYIQPQYRPAKFIDYNYFHPTFLYESMLNILTLSILFFLLKTKPKSGIIFCSYIFCYSIIRIITETIRIDSVCNLLGIPLAIWVSLILIILSLLGLLHLRKI